MGTSGYDFHDASASQDGITALLLRGSAQAGHSKLIAKGTGGNLSVPPLPLAPAPELPDVTVQLIRRASTMCWGAAYPAAAIKTNTATEYRAAQ